MEFIIIISLFHSFPTAKCQNVFCENIGLCVCACVFIYFTVYLVFTALLWFIFSSKAHGLTLSMQDLYRGRVFNVTHEICQTLQTRVVFVPMCCLSSEVTWSLMCLMPPPPLFLSLSVSTAVGDCSSSEPAWDWSLDQKDFFKWWLLTAVLHLDLLFTEETQNVLLAFAVS